MRLRDLVGTVGTSRKVKRLLTGGWVGWMAGGIRTTPGSRPIIRAFTAGGRQRKSLGA
jgi:hypothetical protein